jgi:hypothetical protein
VAFFDWAEGIENASPALDQRRTKACPQHVCGYAAGYFYGEIDKVLRRRAGSTKRRFEGVGYGSGQKRLIQDGPLAERDARATARYRQLEA